MDNIYNSHYYACNGASLVLPHEECHGVKRATDGDGGGSTNCSDVQMHLQSMFRLIRDEDTIKLAIRLEGCHSSRTRYLVVLTYGIGHGEEYCIIGVDAVKDITTIGLVLPIWATTSIVLDGDGGFSISGRARPYIFKPVSVQAMWSALQYLHRASEIARKNNHFEGGNSHEWVDDYYSRIHSDRSCKNEWEELSDLISKRPRSPDVRAPEQEATESLIRAKLKELMMTVDLDEVTSKFIRTKLEEQLDLNLTEYKSFIDKEMLIILGQLDSPTEIFEYLYLGSEWNASNLEELKTKGFGKILNVTREIDNFFPGVFDYYNVRVSDEESTEILKYWDNTYRIIRQAKEEGTKVLVHCKMGVSRSASVVIAYIMKAKNYNLSKAMEFVRNKRSCIKPNESFVKQLEVYQGILNASKQRHNSLWRSKSETNLSSRSSSPTYKANRLTLNSLDNLSISTPSSPSVSRIIRQRSSSVHQDHIFSHIHLRRIGQGNKIDKTEHEHENNTPREKRVSAHEPLMTVRRPIVRSFTDDDASSRRQASREIIKHVLRAQNRLSYPPINHRLNAHDARCVIKKKQQGKTHPLSLIRPQRLQQDVRLPS